MDLESFDSIFFFKKVNDLFKAGVRNLNIEHALKEDLLDNKQRKLLEKKILALKMNVIKQFPLPIICAAVYKVGSGVCAQEFEKYIIFIGGMQSNGQQLQLPPRFFRRRKTNRKKSDESSLISRFRKNQKS